MTDKDVKYRCETRANSSAPWKRVEDMATWTSPPVNLASTLQTRARSWERGIEWRVVHVASGMQIVHGNDNPSCQSWMMNWLREVEKFEAEARKGKTTAPGSAMNDTDRGVSEMIAFQRRWDEAEQNRVTSDWDPHDERR